MAPAMTPGCQEAAARAFGNLVCDNMSAALRSAAAQVCCACCCCGAGMGGFVWCCAGWGQRLHGERRTAACEQPMLPEAYNSLHVHYAYTLHTSATCDCAPAAGDPQPGGAGAVGERGRAAGGCPRAQQPGMQRPRLAGWSVPLRAALHMYALHGCLCSASLCSTAAVPICGGTHRAPSQASC